MEHNPLEINASELAVIDTFTPWYLLFLAITVISLILTVVKSYKNGGLREIAENLLLWFLLFGGFANLMTYPVDSEDEITAAIMFVAFGVCRIAKHLTHKKESHIK